MIEDWIGLALRSSFALFIAYTCYILFNSLAIDIENTRRVEEHREFARIEKCRSDYMDNLCAENTRPELNEYCDGLELCMTSHESRTVQTFTAISVLVAKIFNSFTERLEYTALCFICFILFLIFKYSCSRSFTKPEPQVVELKVSREDLTIPKNSPSKLKKSKGKPKDSLFD